MSVEVLDRMKNKRRLYQIRRSLLSAGIVLGFDAAKN